MKKNTQNRDRNFYRATARRNGLISFNVKHFETDLHIQAKKDIKEEVSSWIMESRMAIEDFAKRHPGFFEAETPLNLNCVAQETVMNMLSASSKTGTGPMAAVAGAIAEYCGKRCLSLCGGEAIVENGGDIFIKVDSSVVLSVWAGGSPLTGKIGIKIDRVYQAFGACTSSGTVGHSKSYGCADAVTVIAPSTALADAAATAAGNLVKSYNDIDKAIEFLRDIEEIFGAVVIKGNRLGAWGDIELVSL